VAALYANPNPLDPNTTITGPYSNIQCVTVAAGPPPGAAVSRKMHGAFEGNIPLPLVGALGIEPRTGGNSDEHQMVITFPTSVSVTDAEVTSGTGNVTGFTPSGTEITVDLSDVPNAQRLIVTLFGVNDGTTTGNVSIPMGVLLADVNQSLQVDSGDVFLVQQQNGQALPPSGSADFHRDINTNGFIDSGDVFTVQKENPNSVP
jgi:hypothetical protein